MSESKWDSKALAGVDDVWVVAASEQRRCAKIVRPMTALQG